VWLAGRLLWKKDYQTMLRPLRRRQGRLLIAGEGPERPLRALASELKPMCASWAAHDVRN